MGVATGQMAVPGRVDTAGAGTAAAVARVEVLRDLAAAEPIWRSLQHEAVTTPYQHFDFLAAWQRHVGPHLRTAPFIVVGCDARGRALFLWPLGIRRAHGLVVAEFLGGKHANYNFGLWRKDVARSLAATDLRRLLKTVGAADGGPDLLRLFRQPATWDGTPNPFALLPHQTSVDDCPRLILSGTGEEVLAQQLSGAMRSRLRNKERKLQKLPGYRYFRAADAEEALRLLAAFFPAKASHMAAQGLRNVFAEPGMEDFLRALADRVAGGERPLIEIHALEGGGEMLAFFGAISDGRRLSLMFNTYTLSDHARQSPGLILLTRVVASCADRGITSFDLGVGEAGYKAFFCKEPEPLFDSFLPLSAAGHAAAAVERAAFAAKRRIKSTPALYGLVQRARRALRGAKAQGEQTS
jgi:CelD/BcsL family acetyltransferase involved in cellulose biosynthesis